MELGAGTGLCGLMIASMVPDCTVELTDLPELQDLMRSNVKRNFGTSSSSGDAIVLCRVLWWGVESDHAGAPYDVVFEADVVASPYHPVALSRTLHALSGPWTRVYVSGKVQLVRMHVAFEGEMARPFARVRRVDGPRSRLRSPDIFIIVADGKR